MRSGPFEFALPVWNGALTETDCRAIEKVKKRMFKIILQDQYLSYESACAHLNFTNLRKQRENICLNFALKELEKTQLFIQEIQSLSKH